MTTIPSICKTCLTEMVTVTIAKSATKDTLAEIVSDVVSHTRIRHEEGCTHSHLYVCVVPVDLTTPQSLRRALSGDAGTASIPPSPAGARTPADLIAVMHELRWWAGSPSLRELSKRAGGSQGGLPHNTLHNILHREHKLPRPSVLKAFVEACGAGPWWSEWNQVWANIQSLSKTATV